MYNTGVCVFTVLEAHYRVTLADGVIQSAAVHLVGSDVTAAGAVTLTQRFTLSYHQAEVVNTPVALSGAPGYLPGMPIPYGIVTQDVIPGGTTALAVIRYSDNLRVLGYGSGGASYPVPATTGAQTAPNLWTAYVPRLQGDSCADVAANIGLRTSAGLPVTFLENTVTGCSYTVALQDIDTLVRYRCCHTLV